MSSGVHSGPTTISAGTLQGDTTSLQGNILDNAAVVFDQAGTGTYAARYPLSSTQYTGVFQAEVSCEAFSPILPGDYQRTSYPVAVFVWTLTNPTNRPLDLSLLLSWRNTTGWFTNTDPSAAVHFRDDGSPEHNYVPAIGRSDAFTRPLPSARGSAFTITSGLEPIRYQPPKLKKAM